MLKRLITIFAGALLLAGLWGFAVLMNTENGWFRSPLVETNDAKSFGDAAIRLIEKQRAGNIAFVLLENGNPVVQHYASKATLVNGDTLFQVASLSKWITAWGVMSLVDEGKLDLDAPISTYLSRWELPQGAFDNSGVTIRRLLSHTAGLTDGLGYAGFEPGTPVQGLTDSLTKAADASPGKDGAVRVGVEPGSEWRYSGGGYTLLQLLIEEVSGQSFNDFMTERVFTPLGMTRSTFIIDGKGLDNIATAYDTAGEEATLYRFTALAAASLYTSANDLTKFLAAQRPGSAEEAIGRDVLKAETVAAMYEPHASTLGLDIWGLGTMLYAPTGHRGFIVGHDGSNEPAINTAARLDPTTGDGIILLETGNKALASNVAGEWVFWKTGKVDFIDQTIGVKNMFLALIAGWLVILAGAVWLALRARKTLRQTA
ncbi:serine hydrolase domain-containing protein [Kordiimonas aestuarii]|uniref:serine hydrolase domain-containing protein n=1 Tax=Kordiimonas aestuarii TaxID=1005925 RepID=UPI0021CE9513|nr:serine hydrolase domain-containing protein [Kordiimonas aestuarii]